MAALTTAIVASAAVGAGAAIYSANQNSKAIKRAGDAQAKSSSEAINYAREARDHAQSVLSKYSVEGDAARARMQSFLGLNTGAKPTASASYSGALGGPKQDYAAYVQGNADLAAEWAKPEVQRQFGGNKAAYGEWHSATFPQEGRDVPMTGGQQGAADSTAVPAETQEQAWAAYEATPWGKIGTMEAANAQENFLSRAGAQGASLAGRTARGMSEVAEESKLRNFSGYYGALGGVADTGFAADSGIASGGQQFAQTAANVAANQGTNAANIAIAQGQNNANLVGDLASWVGWGIGNWPGATGSTPSAGAGRKTGGGSTFSPSYSGYMNRGRIS